ncbi:hypothetical protein ACSS9N_000197 [Escherichia coli]
MTTETYSPDDFILGPDLVVTTVGHFQGGINVPRLTPIMLDATVGTFKVWDGLASLPPQLILAPVLQTARTINQARSVTRRLTGVRLPT